MKVKKILIVILLFIVSINFYTEELNLSSKELKPIEFCKITFVSEMTNYSSEIKMQKNSLLMLRDFPQLKTPKYKLIGWKYKNTIITNNIIITNDMLFEAIWQEKVIQPSDWIQILVVFTALLGIVIPIWIQWLNKKKEQKEKDSKKPKLRLNCDEKDEGIFTKCRLSNNNDAFSFKIRVFNDGYTTAKNVQIKIKDFVISNPPNIAEFNYSFMKLNWSYQDQNMRLNLPLVTKMDIQPQSYEDCDFVFIDRINTIGYFASEQSKLLLNSTGSYRVSVIVSGDNILSDEYIICFYFDRNNMEAPVKVNSNFQSIKD